LLIDIMRCPGLTDVAQNSGYVAIGAACRQSRIELSPAMKQSVPLLCEALGWVAMPQVRSRGTVVGCLAQANAGAEVPVVALALDAQVDVLLPRGLRQRMPAREIYAVETGTRLPLQSLITSAKFRARAEGEGWGFSEVQLRQGHFALVCCAATLLLDRDGRVRSAKIAMGGLTANPYRADRSEAAFIGQTASDDSVLQDAAQTAVAERPWPARTDLHATAAFRSKTAVTAVIRALKRARSRCLLPGRIDG
jgi:CO/xanthine dehydrogenase FAD-binding subunit